MPKLPRYGPGARVYDVVSGERLVYRIGRVAGIEALRLSPGDVVLDLGCGTGLNLPYLVDEVGTDGVVIGVDRSPAMLRVARDKIARNGWRNVRLVEADVADLGWHDLRRAVAANANAQERDRDHDRTHDRDHDHDSDRTHDEDRGGDLEHVDAALATYAMSVFDDWRPAWALIRSALAPGGRVSIVDMARPIGLGALLTPLAALACAVGGADLDAAPWRELTATGTDVSHSTYRSGHIHVVAGSFP